MAVDTHVGHLEQRAEAAATALKQAKGAKNALQREIAELHDQLQRLTKAAQKEAKTLAELKQQAKAHRLDRVSNTDADDRSIAHQLERRASRVWRSLTPDRLRGGGVAVALSVVVVVLVGIVGRFSRAENDTTANPPPPPLLASRALEFTPIEAVALWTPATIGGSNERLYDNRPASLQAPPPVRQVVVSETPVDTSGNETAGVREASVGIAGDLPQFLGTLVIESEPAGATVFVNQQQVGVTPVLLKGLRARSYVVRVEREGYERWSTAVTVSTIHEAHVTATLQRDRGR